MATMTLDFEIFVPREITFDLFTSPQHLREFYPATPCDTRQFSLDVVTGGTFDYQWGDDQLQQDSGTFTRVVAPEGYTTRVLHDGELARVHTLTVKLSVADGRTQIEISEDGFATTTKCERCKQAWVARLQSMTSYLSSI